MPYGTMQFQFDAYAVNDDFAVNCSNDMLQRERNRIIECPVLNDRPTLEKLDDAHTHNLFQIRLLMENLRWLMNEGVQENLSDVVLYYMDDMCFSYAWSISGKVGAHTANERMFEIDFKDDWYREIEVCVAGEVVRTTAAHWDESDS